MIGEKLTWRTVSPPVLAHRKCSRERLVLINVPVANQHAIVSFMVALARPGGILATESWDRASHACYPEHPSWQVLNDAYREAVRPTNGDGTSGRTLPWLLRSAGVTNIRTKVTSGR